MLLFSNRTQVTYNTYLAETVSKKTAEMIYLAVLEVDKLSRTKTTRLEG